MRSCPAVHSPQEAAAAGRAPGVRPDESNVQAYKHVSRGNADGGHPPTSKYVLTQHFSHPLDGARLSGAGVRVALSLENGGVRLLTTDQSAHTTSTSAPPCWECRLSTCQVRNCWWAAASAARRT